MRYYKAWLGLIFLLVFFVIFCWLNFLTFNPFSNYKEIQTIRKVTFLAEKYAQNKKTDFAKIEVEKLTLNQAESNFFQSHGIKFDRNSQNNLIVIISEGFDDTIIFNHNKNCWGGTKTILFLNKCQS